MAGTIVSNIVVFSDASGHGNQSHLVYAPVQQRWWLFYFDTKTATTVKTMVSSSNNLSTATWSAGSASSAMAHALSTNDQRNLAAIVVPNSINANDAVHVSVGIQATSGTGYVEHVRCTFTGAASITWGTWSELASSSTLAAPAIIKGNALGVSTTGKIHEACNTGTGATTTAGINGDPNARASTNNDTAGTWTTGFGAYQATDDAMSFQCNAYAIAPLATGAMIMVYEDASVSNTTDAGLKYNKYSSGTTWPNNTGAATVGSGSTTQDDNDWCLCGVDTTHIYAFRRTASGIDCRLYNGTAWSTPTSTIPAETTKAGSGMFAATDGTSLWLFDINSTGNGAIKYVKGATASGTISFDGTWTILDTAGATARNYISGCPVVANNQIGVIYTAVNGSNFDIGLSVLSVSGATANTQSLTGSGSGAGALTKAISKSLTTAGTGAGAVLKAIAKAFTGAGSGTGVYTKIFGKPFTGTGTGTGTITKAAAKPLTGTGSGTGATTKQTAKTLTRSGTGAGALLKVVTKAFTGSGSGSGVLSILRVILKTLTGSGSGTGAITKATSKPITGSGTGTGAITKASAKPLTGTGTGTGTVTRKTSKGLTGTGSGTGIFSALRVVLKALTGNGSGTGALTRLSQKTLSGIGSGTGTILKRTAKALSGVGSGIGSLTKLTRKFLVSAGTGTGNLTRQVGGGVATFFFQTFILRRK